MFSRRKSGGTGAFPIRIFSLNLVQFCVTCPPNRQDEVMLSQIYAGPPASNGVPGICDQQRSADCDGVRQHVE
jgi:hypothetical protein